MITSHDFLQGRDGRCAFIWYTNGSGSERERCGHEESRHSSYVPEPAHEDTKRVLFHLVNTYQSWRDTRLGVPNEFTDDAVRIGEQHLRLVDWFPEEEGWFPNNTDLSPNDGPKIPQDAVLSLIDYELNRLRTSHLEPASRWRVRRRGWLDGVRDARQAAAGQLQKIRDAYVVESLVRESEAFGLYDIQKDNSV